MSNEAEEQTTLASISMRELEHHIYIGSYGKAEQILQVIMKNQRIGKMEFNLEPANRELTFQQKNIESYQVIEKLASLLTKMFTDTSYVASEKMFNEFTLGKQFLAYIFTASSYQNTDHIIRILGLGTKTSYSKKEVRLFLMIYIPDSSYDLPWLLLAKHMPADVCRAYLGLMSSLRLLMSEAANAKLNQLAKLAKDLPLIGYKKTENLVLMTTSYFGVSNLTGEDKYEFKKWAVRNFQTFMQGYLSDSLKKKIVKKVLKKPSNKGKKTVLVIHESYNAGHAMYRCYHTMIAGLNGTFNVIGMAEKKCVDELGKNDFADFIEFDDEYDIEDVINKILKISPDIIYYPSIGMSTYVPLLATQRLAPIQCMTPGHPSSSKIKTIDFLLHNYMGVDKKTIQKYFVETTVEMGRELQPMPHAPFEIMPFVEDDIYRICVNGVLTKVNHELIDICHKITQSTDKNIEFQFFFGSSSVDIDNFSCQSMLRRYLPNSKIHLYSDYNSYMNVLAQCKFAIPTIPFGGSNSNMDCLRVNLPKLYIVDERVFVGYTDHRIWQALGITSGFCKSIEDLVERAITLVNNESELYKIQESFKNFDLVSYDEKVKLDEVDTRMSDTFEKLIAQAT